MKIIRNRKKTKKMDVEPMSHLDPSGRIRMVDVSHKLSSFRQAAAEVLVITGAEIIQALREQRTPKGNVFETARLAGIMAAKRTSELIPLCHALPLSSVDIDFEIGDDHLKITAVAKAAASTGVEMEALTAAALAALTIYDMLKALSHDIVIRDLRLLSKSGGKSGNWQRSDP